MIYYDAKKSEGYEEISPSELLTHDLQDITWLHQDENFKTWNINFEKTEHMPIVPHKRRSSSRNSMLPLCPYRVILVFFNSFPNEINLYYGDRARMKMNMYGCNLVGFVIIYLFIYFASITVQAVSVTDSVNIFTLIL